MERGQNSLLFLFKGGIGGVEHKGIVATSFDSGTWTGIVLGHPSLLSGAEEPASAIAQACLEAFELMKEGFDGIPVGYPQTQSPLQQRSSRRIGTERINWTHTASMLFLFGMALSVW
jgi:hypothetical protein